MTDKMSAADFLARAVEFLPLHNGPRFPEIRLHHASIAFELATKAAILHGGGTHAECLHARHDLETAIKIARRRGFACTLEARGAATQLTGYYRTHRLADLARVRPAQVLERLCDLAAAHVWDVNAWMREKRSCQQNGGLVDRQPSASPVINDERFFGIVQRNIFPFFNADNQCEKKSH